MPEVIERTVTVRRHEKFDDVTESVPHKVIDAAVGYLTGWAIKSGNYPTVNLFLDEKGDMHAFYTNPHDTNRLARFSMYGMLNANGDQSSYSFHS